MTKLTKIITVSSFILVVAAAVLYYIFVYNSLEAKLDRIVKQNPELKQYVEEIKTFEAKLKEDEKRIETYATLGIVWKSLADRTKNPEHYRRTLEIYQRAIELTKRRNTLFLNNAGQIAEELGDYNLAEEYYKEAIAFAPGEVWGYDNLVNLYRWKLKKSPEEILTIYDQGISKMFNPAPLKAAKEQYLEEIDRK